MDYSNLSLKELKAICKERGIKGYGTKQIDEIIFLLTTHKPEEKIHRLNYIGSKFQLLDWLEENIKEKTGWESFKGKIIGDLFAGTGIVSYHFRKHRSITISNDAELYSSVITHAFALSDYNETCKTIIETLQEELDEGYSRVGYITRNYSPYEDCERMFFTVDNAMKIDYLSQRIDDLKSQISINNHQFLLASLLLSADAVSNVPAVYGCYLKKFKAKAIKTLKLEPIHTNTKRCRSRSNVYNKDVLSTFTDEFDMVYLDPPYNHREYSKNYFPLNMIALSPREQQEQAPLKGVTGIPEGCFSSSFCRKGKTVEEAFDKMFNQLNTEWIFLSYSSESTVSKDKMIEIMRKYGDVSVVEREYKRFKSFEYNEDNDIFEYLFCLKKN
jgi:adenine-specific DNA-methyltransferase